MNHTFPPGLEDHENLLREQIKINMTSVYVLIFNGFSFILSNLKNNHFKPVPY